MSNQKNKPATSNKDWKAPEYNKQAFNCPHCNTYSHHKWHYVYLYNAPVVIKNIGSVLFKEYYKTTLNELWIEQILIKFQNIHANVKQAQNSKLSFCDNCGKYSIWVNKKLVYPDSPTTPPPVEEMPESVKEIYNEARDIVNKSPRGACALLRLAVEFLIKELEEDENNLNKAIGNLVKKGLPKKVQEALDAVRVIGNDAVHPGKINIKDNQEIAVSLFKMLNFIYEKMIKEPKEIEGIFKSLPESKKEAINQRDKNLTN